MAAALAEEVSVVNLLLDKESNVGQALDELARTKLPVPRPRARQTGNRSRRAACA